ncbi:cytidylate kinase [Anaplasma centrale str. Israel]|uniref:Cytidylate kinase n=1 Tax=Anaplasma centrale (strain Israel) TaxID=574556 RepID=D1AU25_ANACI|nr:(d)CMP kinase [Anaplasma centrale]ACZ49053.1 cytidylate kinase [Anaplasma centrale str. Israel]
MTNSLNNRRGRRLVIAIDGPSCSGKGTLAKGIASAFRMQHLNTGKLYRVFAVRFLHKYLQAQSSNAEIRLSTEEKEEILAALNHDSPEYHGERVGRMASILARDGKVRSALLPIQQQFVLNASRGVVVDGRDIASVVCPNADVKIFVSAYVSVRARRRFKQLRNSTRRVMYKSVLFHLLRRDIRDTHRGVAPLVRTGDAIYLNNSHMKRAATLRELVEKIKTFL